ncbi:MAG: hypothetical protein ACI9OE_002293 [Mariniflexile sp.]|jgi:hypothetical protein
MKLLLFLQKTWNVQSIGQKIIDDALTKQNGASTIVFDRITAYLGNEIIDSHQTENFKWKHMVCTEMLVKFNNFSFSFSPLCN